ncbi:MAG: FAD-dependent oxidoreductase [Polyangiaceae bacterium]
MAGHHTIELKNAFALSPAVRTLVFESLDGPLAYRAGQHVSLIVPTPSGAPKKKHYSIASAPNPRHPARFEVAVTRGDGASASVTLHDLAVGSRLEMDGPNGTFVYDDFGGPAIFVTTGSGLAPVRAMLQHELANEDGAPIVLLFGCQNEKDVLWSGELETLRASRPRFRLVVSLSQPSPGWQGRTGYVQTHVLELTKTLVHPRAYVCGRPHMVDEVVALMQDVIPDDRVHTEKYG